MMKKVVWGCALFLCAALIFPQIIFSSDRTLLPPQLGNLFLEKAYRGEETSFLYSRMVFEFQKNTSSAEFKKLLKERRTVGFGTKFVLKLLRQEAFSSDEGMLYYVVQVIYSPFSFKKDFYALEKVRVATENGEWKLRGLPQRLVVGDMNGRCTKNDYMVIYGLMEQDRAREVLAFSRNNAVTNSIAAARQMVQQKEFRRALVEYQKVLQLEQDNAEAKSGTDFCKESLARNENAD